MIDCNDNYNMLVIQLNAVNTALDVLCKHNRYINYENVSKLHCLPVWASTARFAAMCKRIALDVSEYNSTWLEFYA